MLTLVYIFRIFDKKNNFEFWHANTPEVRKYFESITKYSVIILRYL